MQIIRPRVVLPPMPSRLLAARLEHGPGRLLALPQLIPPQRSDRHRAGTRCRLTPTADRLCPAPISRCALEPTHSPSLQCTRQTSEIRNRKTKTSNSFSALTNGTGHSFMTAARFLFHGAISYFEFVSLSDFARTRMSEELYLRVIDTFSLVT